MTDLTHFQQQAREALQRHLVGLSAPEQDVFDCITDLTAAALDLMIGELEAIKAKITIINSDPSDSKKAEYDSYDEAGKQHIEDIDNRLAALRRAKEELKHG